MGCSSGETASLSMDPITREAIETGPTAKSLELPSTEYIRGGTKLESVLNRRKNDNTLRKNLLVLKEKTIKVREELCIYGEFQLTQANDGWQVSKFGIADTLLYIK